MNDHVKGLLITTLGVLLVVPDSLFVRLIQAEPLTTAFFRGVTSGGIILLGLLLVQGGRGFVADEPSPSRAEVLCCCCRAGQNSYVLRPAGAPRRAGRRVWLLCTAFATVLCERFLTFGNIARVSRLRLRWMALRGG